ncbi:MAG: hypothetical protein JNN05_05330 [Candidatus Omnitrophica bacterium]|nr:hypothetical protein [Candidatus Omnitrophota bacterium]
MRKFLNFGPVRFVLLILVFLFMGSLVRANDLELQKIESAEGVAWLQPCEEKVLGVDILCNKIWKQDVGKNSITFTISEDPAVLLTVARSAEVFTGIDELSLDKLKKMGHYAEGFDLQKLTIGSNPAVKVQGYSEGYPDIRLLDLYVYHDFRIYSFLFSVSPGQDWERFSVLVSDMIKSISFVDPKK